jgi:mannose-1-phosphate guanylyltransferase
VQALILAGGEGTRLRPLTSTTPKPVVPLVDRPFIVYMLEWLRDHGVDDTILSCGFMAEGVRAVLGDGSAMGVRLRYVEEPRPLGTGGALKFAEDLLEARFFMLNGDVLTDIDLTEQLRQHEETGARVTLALIPVQDPSAYGLVRRNPDLSVSEFVEKPSQDEIDTNLVNAGAYIIEREVLSELAPAGTRISIERDVFPRLVGRGLFGYEADGYWLDIGTPQRYLQATFDILEGDVRTEVGRRLAAAGGALREDGEGLDGVLHAPALVGAGCRLSAGTVLGGRTVLGRDVSIGSGAHIESSVLLDGCRVGEGTRISASILADGVSIGPRCRVEGGVVLGAGVSVGADNVLRNGMRIFPGVQVPAGAIAF